MSDTRWEAHAKATSAIKDSYPQLIKALQSIQDDTNEKGDTRRQAGVLQQKMEELEFVFMLHLWTIRFERFQKVSKTLQNPEVTLNTCANFILLRKTLFPQLGTTLTKLSIKHSKHCQVLTTKP